MWMPHQNLQWASVLESNHIYLGDTYQGTYEGYRLTVTNGGGGGGGGGVTLCTVSHCATLELLATCNDGTKINSEFHSKGYWSDWLIKKTIAGQVVWGRGRAGCYTAQYSKKLKHRCCNCSVQKVESSLTSTGKALCVKQIRDTKQFGWYTRQFSLSVLNDSGVIH